MRDENQDILELWRCICEIVNQNQNDDGSTRNPVVKTYTREIAFSSNILSTNYKITQNQSDLETARKNFDFVVATVADDIRFDEPIWTPRGESLRKGSLPATVFLIEALTSSSNHLKHKNPILKYKAEISEYLNGCRNPNGLYSHDTIQGDGHSHNVINTTLMAEWLKAEFVDEKSKFNAAIISKSQLKSGVMPYLFPNFGFERYLDKLSSLVPGYKRLENILLRVLRDKSFFFSDFLHHAVSLQYFLKLVDTPSKLELKIIRNAMKFIETNLIFTDGMCKLDFSWEPQPKVARYSNFKDTTTYFVLMEIYYFLHRKKLITREQFLENLKMLSKYVLANLLELDHKNNVVGIKPYEGTDEEINLIFPRPAESVFHKGHLMCNSVLSVLNIVSDEDSSTSELGLKKSEN